MAELRRADTERLLEFVGDAHSVDGPEAFTTELLDRLAEAMKSEYAASFEFDADSPAAKSLKRCAAEISAALNGSARTMNRNSGAPA